MTTQSTVRRKLRVCHVIGGSGFGGDTIYMFDLIGMIRQMGGDADVVTTTPETIRVCRDRRINVVEVPFLQREISPLKDLLALVMLWRCLCVGRYDLVHTHTSKAGFIGRLAAWMAGIPVVVHTIHGFSFHNFSSVWETKIYSSLERIAARVADVLISVNDHDRETALRMRIIPKEKIVTIKNGVDPERFSRPIDRTALRRSLGVEENVTVVGSIGRMASQKGPRYFIEMARTLAEIHPPIYFVLVGDGPDMAKIEAMARKTRLGGRLILTGFRTDAANLLRCFDIFVLASLWEGLPITLLEAMCAGKPIVVTHVKGNVECVCDGREALLVPPCDGKALANAVAKLIASPELAGRLARNAKRRFCREFTKERMVRETRDLYERLLSTKLRTYPSRVRNGLRGHWTVER